MAEHVSTRADISEPLPKISNSRLAAIVSTSVGLCCFVWFVLVAFVLSCVLLMGLGNYLNSN